MAGEGRSWGRRKGSSPADPSAFKRPSERSGAGQSEVSPRRVKEPKRSSATPPRVKNPSPEAMARAKARLEPPKAPWHPLPLAELAIVLGAIGMGVAALRDTPNGLIAGFLLLLAGTAEFSWREHRHGYRQHGAILSGIIAISVALIAWKLVGLQRNHSLGIGLVVFFLGWGVFTRGYTPRDPTKL